MHREHSRLGFGLGLQWQLIPLISKGTPFQVSRLAIGLSFVAVHSRVVPGSLTVWISVVQLSKTLPTVSLRASRHRRSLRFSALGPRSQFLCCEHGESKGQVYPRRGLKPPRLDPSIRDSKGRGASLLLCYTTHFPEGWYVVHDS